MKIFLLLSLIVGALPSDYNEIDGEFVIRLDNSIPLDEVLEVLSSYDIEVFELVEFSSGILMLLEDVDDETMAMTGLEVLSMGPNKVYSIQQSCSFEPCPEVWGLDRIDQRNILGYSDPESPDSMYEWGVHNGDGVYAYVVDTGIAINDTEFEGRAEYGMSAISDAPLPEDDNGHGTHVSGIIGSRSYGIAKECTMISVKVLNGSGIGTSFEVVMGLVWVLDHHNSRGTDAKSVVNMSLSVEGVDDNIESAVRDLVNASVTVVVAAGNDNNNSCNYSPASEPLAITVGATNIGDESADFSNWGPCLDIYAPGVHIKSTWIDGMTVFLDGTSMACPHVAGAVARLMSSLQTPPTPAFVDSWLKDNGTPDVLNLTLYPDHDTGPNLFLYAPCILP